MILMELKSVGGMLTSFWFLFGMCFEIIAGRRLFKVYKRGQLSKLRLRYRVHEIVAKDPHARKL